jgi:hypothetical protein
VLQAMHTLKVQPSPAPLGLHQFDEEIGSGASTRHIHPPAPITEHTLLLPLGLDGKPKTARKVAPPLLKPDGE